MRSVPRTVYGIMGYGGWFESSTAHFLSRFSAIAYCFLPGDTFPSRDTFRDTLGGIVGCFTLTTASTV